MLRATVSGSFHRHMPAIYDAVGELRALGVDVLSPSDPRVVDHIGEFLFVASDRLRSIKLVQDRHLEAIRASSFLWVVCPDGYTGPSTSMEIGGAYIAGVPVFSDSPALDITLGQYVTRVSSMREAVSATKHRVVREPDHVLLDPDTAVEGMICRLERFKPLITGRSGDGSADAEASFNSIRGLVGRPFGATR